MNELSFPTVQMFFTAGELADLAERLGFRGLPHTKRGVNMVAERQGWADKPADLCRKRAGKAGGGGLEYHISLVPDLQGLLLAERKLKTDIAARNARAVAEERALIKAPDTPVSKIAREIGTARAAVLTAIIGYAARRGMKISQAMAAFLTAQEHHQAWADACDVRDRGGFLPAERAGVIHAGSPLEREDGFWISAETVRKANSRGRSDTLQMISGRTLARWLKSYEAGGADALIPDATKAEQPIPAEFWRFMRFHSRPAKPRVTRSHSKYVHEHDEPHEALTLDQVKYYLRHRLNHIEKNAGREGPLTLRARMAYVERDTSGLLPTSVYTADGKTFDAETADPVSRGPMRPELTSILDVATKYCVGWAVSRKENVIAVTEALRNACIGSGVPALFYVDRGPGYKNKRFDDDGAGLMARLGITKMHALPYGSQAKGLIERSHQSIWDPLARDLPTYLGEEMDKEARQAAFKKSRREIKEFGWSRLLLSWDDFRARCQAEVDRYNTTPHSSLDRFVDPETGRIRHMTPKEAWDKHVQAGFEAVAVDQSDIDDLFRPYVKRKVSRCLVEWATNTYFSLDLNAWHGQWVYVGYDDAQADRVWVREVSRSTDEPGRLICVAVFGGNKVDYIPRTVLEQAEERRVAGQIKRLDEKRRAIEAQRVTPWLIEHQPEVPANFIDSTLSRDPEPVVLAVDNAPSEPAAPAPAPRRRTFASDEELAVWALAHPDELIPTQIAVLQRCLSRPTSRENFRANGIDTEALRTLLRAAAANPETSGMRRA